MPRLCGLIASAVRFVLERHPAVAGLRQRSHHAAVQFTGRQALARQAARFGLGVRILECLAPQIGQFGYILGIEQRPRLAALNALHEQIRNPIGDVQVVRAPGLIAGVIAQFQEGFDIRMPALQVHACGPFALAALIDGGDRGIQRFQPRHDTVRQTVGGTDQRSFRSHPVPGDADAAGELRQQGDILVFVVDPFQRIVR